MPARVVMVQGTSSSVGKSLLVTALCRLFARRGMRVAPFKAQNISNNAAVCADGSEIGRSQAVQALAAGIAPTAEMNPILLKPEGRGRSQMVLLGRAHTQVGAREYMQSQKTELWSVVTGAFERLRAAYDLVVMEGAGSPAELNLRARDLVNMAMARYAAAPVLLVGDIERGGIFAQLLGTYWLLDPAEQALVRGFVVNKFRGDASLFDEGVRLLEERSSVPVLGVLPFLSDLYIPEEDAADLAIPQLPASSSPALLDIAVLRLPHIANFDDFAPLASEMGVRVRYVSSLTTLGTPRAIIIPGTKSTMHDLAWLREQGLAQAVQRLAQAGSAVVGICGGYQMLGRSIRDPDGLESPLPEVAGLGLLPVETLFAPEKATHQAVARILSGQGWFAAIAGETITGYEIHLGRTPTASPWLEITRRGDSPVAVPDGAASADGTIWGCYVHGLFANRPLRRAWLQSLGWQDISLEQEPAPVIQHALDRLATHTETHLDMARLESMIWA
ncbi:MAG: cobyric acid synthase [Candidatus Tectimicrobiota bacterium]